MKTLNLVKPTFDIKSRLGVLAEYYTAYHLAVLTNSNTIVLSNTQFTQHSFKCHILAVEKRIANLNDINKGSDIIKSIERQSVSGFLMASTIKASLPQTNCKIVLTGLLDKNRSVSDIMITDMKDGIIFESSLKAYKSPNINLSNTSIDSLYDRLFGKNVITDDISSFGKIIPRTMKNLTIMYSKDQTIVDKCLTALETKDFSFIENSQQNFGGLIGAINTITNLKENKINDETVYDIFKKVARAVSKNVINTISDKFVNDFNELYARNPQILNENFLNLIGIRNNICACVITKNNKMIINNFSGSATATRLKEFTQNDFLMVANKSGKNTNIIIKQNGKKYKCSLAISDSGFGSGFGGNLKFNCRLNMANFQEKVVCDEILSIERGFVQQNSW